jgi:quinol monooxygenase YgiN
MYGTIARLKVKPDRVEALQRLTASYDDLAVPGFVGTHVYRMDADETEYYLVVMFQDRDTYRKNAEDPAQDRRYREMRELLVEDPEWHDGEVVWTSSR